MAWNVAVGSGNRSLIHSEWTRVGTVPLNDLQHEILEYGACYVDVRALSNAAKGPAMTDEPAVTLKIEDSTEWSGETHSWIPAKLSRDKRIMYVYARCSSGKTAFVTMDVTLTFLSNCIVNEYDGGKLIAFLALEVQRLDQALDDIRDRLDALEPQGG